MNIYEIIMLIMCLSFFITLVYIVWSLPNMDEHPVHHDHLPGSYYSISHKVQRDERGY